MTVTCLHRAIFVLDRPIQVMDLYEVRISTNLVCNWFDTSKTCKPVQTNHGIMDTFAPQWVAALTLKL
jgi:hypothetical protein